VSAPEESGRQVENGLISEEIGLDDGVAVLQQLGLITADLAQKKAADANSARIDGHVDLTKASGRASTAHDGQAAL
jgi:hypothetical protein